MQRMLTAIWTMVTLLVGVTSAIAADYTIDLTHSHIPLHG